MQLAVTIKHDEELKELEEIRTLIEALKRVMTAGSVTILEAPTDLDYPYPFPVVTISENKERSRHYGTEAVEKLRSLVQHG